MTTACDRARPLAGVRVLDFTLGGAGPLLTKILGDFGADVAKVESRQHPDFPRTLPPYAAKTAGINRSAYFTNRNSSKRSILLDLRNEAGLKTARALAAQADIIANNFRGGVLERLGLGYTVIAAENPRVIYLSMPMTPTSGPAASYGGVGRTISAMTGIYGLTGYADGEITGPGTHFPDHAVNPGHGLVSVLSALYARRKSGRGACIEMAQIHSTLQILGPALMAAANTGKDPLPVGNQTPEAIYAGALLGSDDWFVLTIASERELERVANLFRESGDSCWSNFTWERSANGRVVNLSDQSRGYIVSWCEKRSRMECVKQFQKIGVSAAPVEDAKGVCDDFPELWQVGHLVQIPHPEMGGVVYNAPPMRRKDGEEPSLRSAPLLGQHTDEILRDWLGLNADQINGLRTDKAIE